MRILLVNPKCTPSPKEFYTNSARDRGYLYTPLNLQILASLTPPDIKVEIVDENFEKINFNGDYDLVGVTSYSTSSLTPITINKIYQEFKMRKVPVIFGGPYPSLVLRGPADSIVIGEAESLWAKILSDAKKGQLKKVYKSKKLIDLNKYAYPLPRRDLTKNKKYLFQTVEVSRGCPYKCDFCPVTHINRGKYRVFPIKRIIEDVVNALNNPACVKRYLQFLDDNLTINPQYKIELFKRLIPYDIMWSCHADTNIAKNQRLLSIAAKSGCNHLSIGFESLNQHTLQSINKSHIKVKNYKKAIQTIHNYGIKIRGYFMFGMDDDKPGIGKKTVEFVNETGIDYAWIFPIIPIPNTKLFKKSKKEGRMITKHFSENNEVFYFKMKNLSKQDLIKEFNYFNTHKKLIFKPKVYNKNISLINRIPHFFFCKLRYFDWHNFFSKIRL